MIRLLDLFSGIGGFSLGLERSGAFETVAFCEIDPFCRKVLRKHWPDVPQYEDIRELTGARLAADGIAVDAICGGFPCQDISLAGKGAGIEGERSGLWSEYARIIGEVRPRYVIVENVAALLGRGLSRVLGDLAALGYDAEWHCIPASAVGALHVRDRVWIVAHDNSQGERLGPINAKMACISQTIADNRARGLEKWERLLTQRQIADTAIAASSQWNDLPEVGRAVHGVPNRVDRIKSLGNAVVPQIPEIIGRAILTAEAA